MPNTGFTFLGAILEQYDLSPSEAQASITQSLPLRLQTRSKEKTLTPSATTAVQKPDTNSNPSKRQYIKSNFLQKPATELEADERLKELEKKFPVPQRVPLQL